MIRLAVAAVFAYLAGSVPVAVLVGRRAARVDLRDTGDRNPGYWNAKETLGRRAAVPVFVGDVAKGAVAGALGLWAAAGTDGRWWMAWAVVLAAMVGHAWPVFAGFRGGRAILTFVGGVAVIAPLPALVAVALCAVVSLVTRSFAYGARVGVFGFPVVQLAFSWDQPEQVAATGVLMTFIGLRFAMAALADRRRHPAV